MTEQASSPDTITVTALASEEVSASHAKLFVRIQGTSFFSGQMALTRAREVAQFVATLKELGLTDTDIHFQGVTVSESSGMLSRNSSALYDLKVHCKPLDRLAEVLGAITAQKNIELLKLHWGYENLDALRDTLQDRCLTELNRRARRIVAGLGVSLVGVHHYSELWDCPDGTQRLRTSIYKSQLLSGAKARIARDVDLNTDFSHTENAHFFIEAQYLTSGFASVE